MSETAMCEYCGVKPVSKRSKAGRFCGLACYQASRKPVAPDGDGDGPIIAVLNAIEVRDWNGARVHLSKAHGHPDFDGLRRLINDCERSAPGSRRREAADEKLAELVARTNGATVSADG